MFCPNCGNKNEDDAVFCGFCGTRILEETPPPVQNGYYNNAPGGYYGAPADMQTLPKKQVNKCMVAALVEMAVLVLAVTAFILIGKNAYGYERTAEQFFQALESGNWEQAYEDLDISESEFIDKKHFADINRNQETTEINQFHVLEKNENGISANVTIQYSEKGSSDVSLMYLTLNKQPKKKFLLFDEWKVSSSQYVSQNFYIEVPKGAVLYLDGEEVPEKMREEDECSYLIPRLFTGNHTLAIQIGDFTGAGEEVYVAGEGSSAGIYSLNLSEEQQQELIRLAYEDLQEIINAGIEGKGFSAVSGIYSSEYQDDAEDSYENFLSRFAASGKETGITSIDLENAVGSFSGNYVDNGIISAVVELDYDYTVGFLKSDWWSSKIESGSDDGYGSINLVFVYDNDDGAWKLNTDNMPYFSYY